MPLRTENRAALKWPPPRIAAASPWNPIALGLERLARNALAMSSIERPPRSIDARGAPSNDAARAAARAALRIRAVRPLAAEAVGEASDNARRLGVTRGVAFARRRDFVGLASGGRIGEWRRVDANARVALLALPVAAAR